MHNEESTSESVLIERSGWAFIAASIAFAMILTSTDPLAIPGSLISTILLTAGLLWLRAAYRDAVDSIGRNLLALGAIGGPVSLFIGLIVMVATGDSMATNGVWVLLFVGPAAPLLGLSLFGLVALRDRPMTRLNLLPMLAGIWYPIAYLVLAGYMFTHDGKFPLVYYPFIQLIFGAQFFALFALGFVLLVDRPAKQSAERNTR